MFEKDHIMRQVNLLAHAIAAARALRSEGRVAEAVKELDRACDNLSGNAEPDFRSPMDLFTLCIDQDGALLPIASDLAQLLTLKGDWLAESGKVEDAVEHHRGAQAIYRAILRRPEAGLPWDIKDRLDALGERLLDAGIDDDPDHE